MTNSVAMQNVLAAAAGTAAAYGALASTVGGASAGTELSGGSPAYARKALSWGSASGGATVATAVIFDVASGSTVASFETYSTLTAGTYYQGVAVTSQTFASQGTYSVTPTQTVT